MSNSHQGPPRQYQVFIPTFLWQTLSGGSEADPFDTRISQFFSIFWYKLHRQTDRQTRWLGTVIIGGSWVEWRERQLGWNEKRVKSQWNFLIPFTPDYADIMKRSERLNYTTGMAGWPKKRHVYYVWFIRSKPTNARGIIFCDDISPPQQRSCRSFAIIVLVGPLFLKLVNHRRNSPYLEKQQSPNKYGVQEISWLEDPMRETSLKEEESQSYLSFCPLLNWIWSFYFIRRPNGHWHLLCLPLKLTIDKDLPEIQTPKKGHLKSGIVC